MVTQAPQLSTPKLGSHWHWDLFSPDCCGPLLHLSAQMLSHAPGILLGLSVYLWNDVEIARVPSKDRTDLSSYVSPSINQYIWKNGLWGAIHSFLLRLCSELEVVDLRSVKV